MSRGLKDLTIMCNIINIPIMGIIGILITLDEIKGYACGITS